MHGYSVRYCFVDIMASVGNHAGLNPLDMHTLKSVIAESNSVHDRLEETFTRPGAQLADKRVFENRNGSTVTGYPVLVDFRRLIQLSPSNASSALQGECGIIPGISNRDLLHAIVGLYDVTLSEMTPDVLYASTCEKWARTIILVRDLKETIKDIEAKKQQNKDKPDESEEEEDRETSNTTAIENDESKTEEDKYEEDETQPSKFAQVFSDTESEEEEEEDEDEDFSQGINTFIKKAADRRKVRNKTEGAIQEEHIGIENRIIGCITFEKKYIKKDRVIHLTLLTVRKRFRKYGIGKYLLQQVLDPVVVGHYDAVVVHADNAAIEFFQKYGFSDDVVLNSRWDELAEQFTNCTLMCYLPAFSGHSLLSTIKVPGFEVFELEQEFNKWKEKTTEVYQNQVSIVMRMKHEILQLKYMNEKQNDLLESLIAENDRLKKSKLIVEKEYLDYRLCTAKAAFSEADKLEDEVDDIDTNALIIDLQRQADLMDLAIKKKRLQSLVDSDPISRSKMTTVGESKYISFPTSRARKQKEPYDHMKDAAFFYDVTESFKKGMKLDPQITQNYEVTTISKATLQESFVEAYRDKIKTLHDPSVIVDLYYCGGLEHPERIQDVLKYGFSESDFTYGEYGVGLYFSKYPSKAAQFSALSKIILVEVGLGNIETKSETDKTCKSPSTGYDSIITPGRLKTHEGDGDGTANEEYVVFDVKQVLPLGIISYSGS